MTIATQCPHCQTVFRITPEQLQARAGRVRCGRCQQVFDGFKTLRALEATAAVEPPMEIAPPQTVEAEPQPTAAPAPAPAPEPAPAPTSPSTAAETPSPDLLAALQPSADFLAQFGGTGAVAEPVPDAQQQIVHDTVIATPEFSSQTEPPLADKVVDVDTPSVAPELLAAVQPSEEFLAQFSSAEQSQAADTLSTPEPFDAAATETSSAIWPPAPDVPQPVTAAGDELNFVEPVEALPPEEAAAAEYNAMMASNAPADEATQEAAQDSVAQDDVYAKLSLAPASIAPVQEHSALSLPAEELPAVQEHEQTPRRHKRWWAFAAAFAALALALQGMHAYRSELASSYPALKPLLSQWCAWMRCSVPPLQRPAALNIEASDLQVVDQSRPNIVQLTATLRNKSVSEVGYPALDLVLTDNREHALARRVFVPADYLHAIDAGKAVIAANAEVTVRIDLDVAGLAAAGFRLNLAPAPSI